MTALLRSDWDPSPEFYGLFPELTVLHLQSNCSCYLLLPSPAPTAPGAYLMTKIASASLKAQEFPPVSVSRH